jgi:ubiquinone/menaquinone biosynthesis C-methylase UbiE
MRRLNQENINTPEFYNEHFHPALAVTDIERHEKLAKYFKGGCYLDVGCLDSPMPVILSERFPASDIIGLDFSPQVINFFAPRFPKVRYMLGDAMKLPFGDGYCDYVVAGQVIEHMEDPKAFIDECMRVLWPRKDGAYLAISTPLNESDRCEFGGRQHLWSFTEQDFIDWGFETEILNRDILAWKRK